MAHTKAAGSTKLGRESQSKRLGIKLYGGQKATAGNIIVRQRGTRYIAGENTMLGKDHTIFAVASGAVTFQHKTKKNFTGNSRTVVLVSVKK